MYRVPYAVLCIVVLCYAVLCRSVLCYVERTLSRTHASGSFYRFVFQPHHTFSLLIVAASPVSCERISSTLGAFSVHLLSHPSANCP